MTSIRCSDMPPWRVNFSFKEAGLGDYVETYSIFLLNSAQVMVWWIIEDYVNNHNYLTNLTSTIQNYPSLHNPCCHNLLVA